MSSPPHNRTTSWTTRTTPKTTRIGFRGFRRTPPGGGVLKPLKPILVVLGVVLVVLELVLM